MHRDWSRVALISTRALACVCFLFAAAVAFAYSRQRPLDLFSFRQAQTALTSFWILQDGFKLAYETPVMGPPWSIPFEFPIYQAVVALTARLLGTGLDHRDGCAFFDLLAIRYLVAWATQPQSMKRASLVALFLALALLQKVTTALPTLIVFASIYVAYCRLGRHATFSPEGVRRLLGGTVAFGVPILIGLLWTGYGDRVKSESPLGVELTSAHLLGWNLGTLRQRFEEPLYEQVVWNRIFINNLGGLLGVTLLLLGPFGKGTKWSAPAVGVALLLGCLPIFIFTNLHLVHDYYQCSNLLFVLFAAAVVLGDRLPPLMQSRWVGLLAASFIVASNVRVFCLEYLPVAQTVYNDAADTEMALATVLHRSLTPEQVFVAFDFDWSSSLAYLAERKALMVPSFFRLAESVRADPQRFVGASVLGAVVTCSKGGLRTRQLLDWTTTGRRWKVGTVDDCFIAAPRLVPTSGDIHRKPSRCEATIEVSQVPGTTGFRKVRVRVLWEDGERVEPHVYEVGASREAVHEMLDVTGETLRPDVDRGTVPDRELTVLVDETDAKDARRLRLYRTVGNESEECLRSP